MLRELREFADAFKHGTYVSKNPCCLLASMLLSYIIEFGLGLLLISNAKYSRWFGVLGLIAIIICIAIMSSESINHDSLVSWENDVLMLFILDRCFGITAYNVRSDINDVEDEDDTDYSLNIAEKNDDKEDV